MLKIYNKDKSLNFGEVRINVSFTDLLSEHTGQIKLVERKKYIIYKESKNPTPLLSFSNEVDISGLETVLISPSGNNRTVQITEPEFTKKGDLKVPKDLYMECLEGNRTFITLKTPLIVGANYYYDYRYIYPVVPLDGTNVSNVWDVYPCHSLEEQKGKLPVVWFNSTTVTFRRK